MYYARQNHCDEYTDQSIGHACGQCTNTNKELKLPLCHVNGDQ